MSIYTIKDKKLISLPVLYWESICELVDDRKYRNMTDFISEAVRDKLKDETVDLEPKENLKLDDWW